MLCCWRCYKQRISWSLGYAFGDVFVVKVSQNCSDFVISSKWKCFVVQVLFVIQLYTSCCCTLILCGSSPKLFWKIWNIFLLLCQFKSWRKTMTPADEVRLGCWKVISWLAVPIRVFDLCVRSKLLCKIMSVLHLSVSTPVKIRSLF